MVLSPVRSVVLVISGVSIHTPMATPTPDRKQGSCGVREFADLTTDVTRLSNKLRYLLRTRFLPVRLRGLLRYIGKHTYFLITSLS